jgi:hypothetical protein
MSFRSLLAPIALACAALAAPQAQAANLTVSGLAYGGESVDIALSAPNVAFHDSDTAGGFASTFGGLGSFTSYCVDMYQGIGSDTYADFTLVAASAHSFANSHAATDIGKLYSEGHTVNDATTSAAFQIAIWEIAYETTGIYNLANGSARFTGGSAATSGALALASSWLGAIATTTNTYNVSVLQSPTYQDQVVAVPVPEPSTYALMVGGLLAIGFAGRRRLNGRS